MKVGRLAAVLIALVTPALANAAQVPAGTDIADGMLVHVTPKGIHFLENQVQYIVPPSVAVADQQGTLFSCLFSHNTWKLKNTTVQIQVGKVQITPIEGAIKIHIELAVSADARVETSGCLFNNGCNVHLPSSPVVADTIVDLSMATDPQTGRPHVVAAVPQFAIALALSDPDIGGCLLGDFFSFLIGLFHDTVQGAIVDAVNGQVAPLLQPAIENAFNSLNFDGSLNLAGTDLDYSFYPSALQIHPGTIGIVMGGHFTTPTAAACIDPSIGSTITEGAQPNFGDNSPGGVPYDAAISISDDILNQLVFSAWRGGMLCRTIDSLGGAPLTNDTLAIIGGQIQHLVTPGGPMQVRVEAPEPPLITLGGAGGVAHISLSNLHVDLMSDVDERLARIMRLTLGANASVAITINADHQLVVTPNFDPSQLAATVDYNELAPEANATILALLPTLVQQLLPSLADAIPPIDLPALGGITLDSTEITADGPSGDYLSVYTGLGGHVQAGGCNATAGGCGVSPGAGAGCALEGRGNRALASTLVSPIMLGLGIAVVAFRRRRG